MKTVQDELCGNLSEEEPPVTLPTTSAPVCLKRRTSAAHAQTIHRLLDELPAVLGVLLASCRSPRCAPDTGTICLVFRLDGDRVGNGAVAKEFIARHDLERIALQEIRAFPGCEHVTDVEIEHQIDRALKTNWTLHVYTCEGANMERIQYAINTTRQRLRHRYDLRRELSS